jgi:hypothetical protein
MPPPSDHDSSGETLEELAAQIRQAHVMVGKASAAVVVSATMAGQLLIRAQAKVPYGGWIAWVREKCEFSDRTALDYQTIARGIEEGLIDLQEAAGLGSIRSVVAFLKRKKKGSGATAVGNRGNSAVNLAAWSKAARKFIRLTRQTRRQLAGVDPTTAEQFRQQSIDIFVALWPHNRRPQLARPAPAKS